jgi:hypothetical protein
MARIPREKVPRPDGFPHERWFCHETMTRHSRSPTEPTTAEEFQRQLTRLVRAAAANGVEVRGGWACQDDGGGAWDVEIVEVAGDAHR